MKGCAWIIAGFHQQLAQLQNWSVTARSNSECRAAVASADLGANSGLLCFRPLRSLRNAMRATGTHREHALWDFKRLALVIVGLIHCRIYVSVSGSWVGVFRAHDFGRVIYLDAWSVLRSSTSARPSALLTSRVRQRFSSVGT